MFGLAEAPLLCQVSPLATTRGDRGRGVVTKIFPAIPLHTEIPAGSEGKTDNLLHETNSGGIKKPTGRRTVRLSGALYFIFCILYSAFYVIFPCHLSVVCPTSIHRLSRTGYPFRAVLCHQHLILHPKGQMKWTPLPFQVIGIHSVFHGKTPCLASVFIGFIVYEWDTPPR